MVRKKTTCADSYLSGDLPDLDFLHERIISFYRHLPGSWSDYSSIDALVSSISHTDNDISASLSIRNNPTYDQGMVDISHFDSCELSGFSLDKSIHFYEVISACESFLESKLNYSIRFSHTNLLHYHAVSSPRPFHRDSHRLPQWKLFLPLAYIPGYQGIFSHFSNTTLSHPCALVYSFLQLYSPLNKYRKDLSPIPTNYLLSNQCCLHGDIKSLLPIYRSMLTINFIS